MEIRLSESSEERATNKLDSELDTIRGMRPIKVSFIPVKGSHIFHIKNTNRHYADPLNPQIKLDKRYHTPHMCHHIRVLTTLE